MTSREKRWVVRAGDGATVGDILAKAHETDAAVTEGRVFVGRRRVTRAGELVKVGDEVRIGKATAKANAVTVLWERDGMLACVKPAGLPTVPDHEGAAHSLVALVAAQTARTTSELFVTSRLDREVSGVVVFATSAASAQRLQSAREQGLYHRRYVAIAIASASASASAGVWDAPIGRGSDPRHRAALGADPKPSTTRFRIVALASGFALLAVEPDTGRTHQIRVHASHAGMPLLGDRDYGGAVRLTLANGTVLAPARIALHAVRVTVPDASRSPRVALAPVPAELARAWSDLGGDPEAWDMATTCALEA